MQVLTFQSLIGFINNRNFWVSLQPQRNAQFQSLIGFINNRNVYNIQVANQNKVFQSLIGFINNRNTSTHKVIYREKTGFNPSQGLLIIETFCHNYHVGDIMKGFNPSQGLLIIETISQLGQNQASCKFQSLIGFINNRNNRNCVLSSQKIARAIVSIPHRVY